MAADPADGVGDIALSQGLRDTLSAWEAFHALFAPVVISYSAAVAWGWSSGDLWVAILAAAHAIAVCAAVLGSRLGGVSRQAEVHASFTICMSGIIMISSYALLCPWIGQADLALIVAVMPMMLPVIVAASVSFEIGGMRGLHACTEHLVITVVALAAVIRGVCDAEARPTLQPLLVLLPCAFAATRMTRSLGAALLDSQQRLAEECSGAKELAMRSLASSHGALSRVLQALCNAVAEVDVDLNLRSPTWQLHELLMGCLSSDPQELQGRSLLEFTATEEDAAKLRTFLFSETQHAREHSPEQRQQGPASAVNIEMRDSQGKRFAAQLYGAYLMGDGGNSSYILGARLAQDLAAERAPPLPSDEHVSLAWEDVEATPAQVQQMLPSLQGPASIPPGAQADGRALPDASRIELRFDAGSVRANFTRANVITGSLRKSARMGVLDLLGQADGHTFDRWVVQQVHEEQDFTDAGQTWTPTPFPGLLNLKLPKQRKQQVLQSRRAWLQVHEGPTRIEQIPATLWLEDLRLLDRSEALAVLEEEDVDGASESSDDIEHESVSAAGSD